MYNNQCGSCIYWCSYMEAYVSNEEPYDYGFCDCPSQVKESTPIDFTCPHWESRK